MSEKELIKDLKAAARKMRDAELALLEAREVYQKLLNEFNALALAEPGADRG